MPSTKKVQAWGFKYVGLESDENGEVTKVYCKICREYSALIGSGGITHNKEGIGKVATDVFVTGIKVVKRNNFCDHVLKSKTHNDAVNRLSEHNKDKESLQASLNPSTPSTSSVRGALLRQTTMIPHIPSANKAQRAQLTKKMQLARFAVVNSKAFSFYEKMANFCKDEFKVRK